MALTNFISCTFREHIFEKYEMNGNIMTGPVFTSCIRPILLTLDLEWPDGGVNL